MKRIVYAQPDGSIAVVTPVISVDDPASFTDAQALERSMKKLPKNAVNVTVVDSAQLPDRAFRDAWVLICGRVAVDMPKAREIQRTRIRAMRSPKLSALDVEYQRADERGDVEGKKAIAAQKQALRDATANPAIEAATTTEELKAITL